MKKAIIAFISLIIFCIEPLMASAEFSFKKYQVENGLSHNTTWCAIQDSYGFLWIGTSNGLNCYYGSGNKIYRNVLNDKYSLGNNFVGSLMEEGEDLWIGQVPGYTFMIALTIISCILIRQLNMEYSLVAKSRKS